MRLEWFLWNFTDDEYQIIRVLIDQGETIKITSIFDLPILDVFVRYEEFESLLKRSVKSVRASGSNKGEGHALEIFVWDNLIK